MKGWWYSSRFSVEYEFIVALCVPWCRDLEALPAIQPLMRITSSAVLSVPVSSLLLLGSLLSMLGLSVRMSLLGSVFSSAPPRLLGGH